MLKELLNKVSAENQLAEIKRGCAELIGEKELLEKIRKAQSSGVPLKIKLGADPSRPDLHLGHMVVVQKLKAFQDFGHEVYFLIGDFTGRIGDPTGRNKTRPELSEEEIRLNAKTYQRQIFKVLDPEKTKIVFNNDWLSKLTPNDFIKMMASHTLQQVLARDDFSKRYHDQSPIFLHELLYSLLQAYDSVHLDADVELGGTDQKFNLLMGRELQRFMGKPAQAVLTMPLLEGLDGVQKMSKSYDNYIGIDEEPNMIFGKTMSITDTHMIRFYELLGSMNREGFEKLKAALADGSIHPMKAKKDLAKELVTRFWGAEAGVKALEHFEKVFSEKKIPDQLSTFSITKSAEGTINMLDVSVQVGFSPSKSDARRVIQQKGMKLDEVIVDSEKIAVSSGQEMILRQGKIKICKLCII